MPSWRRRCSPDGPVPARRPGPTPGAPRRGTRHRGRWTLLLAAAVLTDRRHVVDGALETVEDVALARRDHLEGLVVVVSTDFTPSHCQHLDLWALSDSRAVGKSLPFGRRRKTVTVVQGWLRSSVETITAAGSATPTPTRDRAYQLPSKSSTARVLERIRQPLGDDELAGVTEQERRPLARRSSSCSTGKRGQ